MTTMVQDPVPAHDLEAERATLGALILFSDPRRVLALVTSGLRPEHFYNEGHAAVFSAAVSLADHQANIDPITLRAEMERLGKGEFASSESIDVLAGYVPAAGHVGDYAERVMELARWRRRQRAVYEMQSAVATRDAGAWAQARSEVDSATAGTRTESYSPAQWASLLFDYFSADQNEMRERAIPSPFPTLTHALGGGLYPGELLVLGGPTSHGKSILADQWTDVAAAAGKSCHLYMTEMTAITRGWRYLARRTGVPFMRQRRLELTDEDRRKVLAELSQVNYGITIAADWDVDDIVRDALSARYDFVVVDLLHGFHYHDERDLDRLVKAMQRLARVSTTVNGHVGTSVIAVCHLKEEGLVKGKIPRPTLSSLKGASSIKQDADFVMFVWQEQNDRAEPTGEAEIWIPKARSGERACQLAYLNPRRFRFDPREQPELDTPAASF